ncbi:unnamed protein product [Adineta steineri]|uniref:K Homology domain-containing protein n=1 Tax=Adineta steineri TaxID=433720 RepID=A0A815J6B2_9BILA|nr:unnamed protein product [Adineta steineri]
MASNKYIVHSRKNVSKFHTAANQLRRENTFSNDIYQELPKRYCSYNGNNGKYNYLIRFSYFISLFTRLKAIDLDILRQMCEDTTLSLSSILKSRFSSNMNKFVKLLKSKMIYLSSKYVYILLEENDTTTDEEESQDSLPITQQFYPTFINRNPIRFHRPSYPLCRNTISRSIPVIVNKNINNQQTPSNEENTMNEFLQFLESFKIITATDGCIVHNSKYQSKFNNAINLIRRGKKYKNSIYHELPKRCCSCNGKKGLNVIDLNVLINICDEISLDKSSETIKLSFEPETDSRALHRRISRFIGKKDELGVLIRGKHPLITTDTISMDEIKQELNAKWEEASEFEFIRKELFFDHNHFQFVCLSFESELSLHECRKIIGRFIGKNGEHIRGLQDKYNIRIQIVDQSFSRKIVQKKFAKIQDKDKLDKLYLLIRNKNKIITEKIRIDMIKEDINKLWKNEEKTNNLNHTQSSELNFLSMSSIELNSDNRWNKKKGTRRK